MAAKIRRLNDEANLLTVATATAISRLYSVDSGPFGSRLAHIVSQLHVSKSDAWCNRMAELKRLKEDAEIVLNQQRRAEMAERERMARCPV